MHLDICDILELYSWGCKVWPWISYRKSYCNQTQTVYNYYQEKYQDWKYVTFHHGFECWVEKLRKADQGLVVVSTPSIERYIKPVHCPTLQRRGRGRGDSYRILGAVVSICPAPSCQYLSGLNSAFVWSWIQYLSAQLENVLYWILGWIELGCDICIAICIVESQICGWGHGRGWTC